MGIFCGNVRNVPEKGSRNSLHISCRSCDTGSSSDFCGLTGHTPVQSIIMDCQRIQMVLTIAFFSMLSLLASTRNLPESLTGTCTCTVNVSNQEVTYINDCTHRFEPSHEVLVMPLHPGTGSPRVKAHCICHCDLNLSGGSFY